MKTAEQIVQEFFNIPKLEYLENKSEMIALVQMAINETEQAIQVQAGVMQKIAGKVDGDTFKEIAEFVELEINEKHSNYWSNIAMGNASARFWHAYKKYVSNFSV